ncbi:MAG: phosphatidate cytidylyltransferase [Chloroflexota bacterium]|nr:phosphatidate cytidylyltransferase [Chloroflexota bacterium]MDE2893191.1 phosphatidate cytidylyltransferase [Chloroflexota bacterium]
MATSASRRERLIAGGLGLRLASAAVGMPIIIAAILVGGPLFAALIALSLAIALGEIAVIVKLDLRSPLFIVGVAAVGAIIGVIASDANIPLLWPILASALGITGAATLSAIRSVPDPEPAQLKPILIGGLAMLAATAYLAIPGTTFVAVRASHQGADWVLLAVLAIMSADAAAYAGGRLLGRHQLAPSVSPNKTLEGALFGWLGGFGATIALDQILNLDVEIWPLVLLALVLPVISQLGDLVESLFKRAMDVKDSSNLIPGHGGVLDRLDSLLFGLPVVYFFLQWTT